MSPILAWRTGLGTDGSSDAGGSGLFEPDVLLPSQYEGAAHAVLAPERRLMIAVLEDAVVCVRKYAGARRERHRRLFEEADAWFRERDSAWPYSFEAIAAVLDIDPEYFRERLLHPRAVRDGGASEGRAPVSRVRLRTMRHHKILPTMPRRRRREQVAA